MIVCKLVFVALFVLSKRLRAWNHGFERSINDYQLSTNFSSFLFEVQQMQFVKMLAKIGGGGGCLY